MIMGRHILWTSLVMLLCGLSNIIYAQTTTLKIVDENNLPITGATIRITSIDSTNNVSQFSISDKNGKASLDIQMLSNVSISFIGYVTQHLPVTPGEHKTIRLNTAANLLQQVVITGQLDITKLNSTVESIKIIEEKLIKQTSANTLRDIISFMPNIRITEDNVLGSNTTINGLGGQNIKLLIDGVPVTGRENGNIDFGQIQLNNIERIELSEGPMSVLYSSDASAGVINLITKKNTDHSYAFNGNIMTEFPRSLYTDAWIGKNFGVSHLSLSGGRNYFDGFPQYSEARTQQWNPYIKYFGTANYGVKYKRYTNELRLSYFDQTTLNRGMPVVTPYDAYAFDQHFYIKRFNVSLHQDIDLGHSKHINLLASYSNYNRRRETSRIDFTNLEQQILNAAGTKDSSIVQQYFGRALFVNTSTKKVKWQSGIDFNYEFAKGSRFKYKSDYIFEIAALAQAEYKPIPALQIKPGLRLNYNSRYKAPVIPALNFRYQVNQNLVLRAALARGYRTPDLKELTLMFVDANHNIYGNENLVAEDSRYAGIRGDYTRTYGNIDLTLSPSLYFTHIKNQIVLAIVDTTALMYQYINLESVHSLGGNVGITLTASHLTANFNYGLNKLQTQIHTEVQSIWTPEFTAQCRWKIPAAGINLTFMLKNVGSTPVYYTASTGINERTIASGYTLADLVINKNLIGEKVTISTGVKNIFNVTTMNALNGGIHSDGGGLAIARGRYYMCGVQWQLTSNKKKE